MEFHGISVWRIVFYSSSCLLCLILYRSLSLEECLFFACNFIFFLPCCSVLWLAIPTGPGLIKPTNSVGLTGPPGPVLVQLYSRANGSLQAF